MIKNQGNARTVLADVTHFDLDKHFVYGVTPDGRKLHRRYDTLVVAGGATNGYFGNDHWAGFAPGMKTLEDARKLRSHILSPPWWSTPPSSAPIWSCPGVHGCRRGCGR